MKQLCKKLILALVTVGLLLSFHASNHSSFFFAKSVALDETFDQENSKNQNCEIEDLKFFDQQNGSFAILKVSLSLKNKDDNALQKNFSAVLTSPPNC